jgi:ATP-binding cassette subfamily G (WHITE) protein 2
MTLSTNYDDVVRAEMGVVAESSGSPKQCASASGSSVVGHASLVEVINECSYKGVAAEKEYGYLHDSGSYQGVDIVFQDLCVRVGRRGSTQTILDNVSGYMNAGTLTALMGPSGSGKTTLVDMVTCRKNSGKRGGVVLYDGKKPGKRFLQYNVAYVQQEDALIENLTVRETFLYNFDLIAGKRVEAEEKQNAIDAVLVQLALDVCQNTIVGSAFQRGISGGQRKRVNIGISLLSNPSVLFMDEPTSGLDSYTAFEVMRVVWELSRRGLTTVSTIHGPNSSIFQLFDKLMVLLDGQVVYFGDAQSPVPYFMEFGFDGPHAGSNDADWLTSIVVQTSRLKKSRELGDYYNKSDMKRECDEFVARKIAESPGHGVIIRSTHEESWMKKTGVWSFYSIIKHRMTTDFKNPNFWIPRIGEKCLFALVILSLYWGVAQPLTSDANYIQELARPMQITTSLFMWSILPVFGSISVIPAIFHERIIFNREKEAGYYNSGSYLMAKVFEEALVSCVSTAILACAVWFALSLSGYYPLFWLVSFVTGLVGVTMAYVCASIAPNTEYAIISCAGLNTMLLFFVGLLIRFEDIPVYWKWLVYINHLHYGWGALMKNQFKTTDLVGPFGIPVLEYFDLDGSATAWDYLGYEIIFVVVFFIIGCLAMRFINYGRR